MKFPDEVTLLRASGADAYGNPVSDWSAPTETPTVGFLVRPTQLLLSPDADVRLGDRVRVNGVTYAVEGEPVPARSPKKTILITVSLARLEV